MPPDNRDQTHLTVSFAFCHSGGSTYQPLSNLHGKANGIWYEQASLFAEVHWTPHSLSLIWDTGIITMSIFASLWSSSSSDWEMPKGEEIWWESIHMAAWGEK